MLIISIIKEDDQMNKILGYVLSGLGLFGLVASSGTLEDRIPIIKLLPNNTMLIAGIVLIAVGIFIIIRAGNEEAIKAGEEVPIYHGKKIVGYRRH